MIIVMPLFIVLIATSLERQIDSLDEIYRKASLTYGVMGILLLAYRTLTLIKARKNKIFIRIYNHCLEYDFIKDNGNTKSLKFNFSKNLIIRYSFIHFSSNSCKTNMKKLDFNDKYEFFLFYPFKIAINFILFLTFFILNLFRIKKYYIFKNDEYMVSVEANKELKDRFGKVPFETLTLTHIV